MDDAKAGPPLAGLRVLELARILAGPWAGQLLADLGATVVKVESPDGDDTRRWGPPFVEHEGEAAAAYFHACNRGKRSVVADFSTEEGRAIVRRLAREAELAYATVAMVTDFDCWHPDHDAVTVQDIIKVLAANAEKAKRLVACLAADFPREHEPCPIGSDRALDTAIITAKEARDPALIAKLDAVAGRVLSA